jgi:hypothetical protein
MNNDSVFPKTTVRHIPVTNERKKSKAHMVVDMGVFVSVAGDRRVRNGLVSVALARIPVRGELHYTGGGQRHHGQYYCGLGIIQFY